MTNSHSKLLKDNIDKKREINRIENRSNDIRIRSYRMQEEYGPKKFIKP